MLFVSWASIRHFHSSWSLICMTVPTTGATLMTLLKLSFLASKLRCSDCHSPTATAPQLVCVQFNRSIEISPPLWFPTSPLERTQLTGWPVLPTLGPSPLPSHGSTLARTQTECLLGSSSFTLRYPQHSIKPALTKRWGYPKPVLVQEAFCTSVRT